MDTTDLKHSYEPVKLYVATDCGMVLIAVKLPAERVQGGDDCELKAIAQDIKGPELMVRDQIAPYRKSKAKSRHNHGFAKKAQHLHVHDPALGRQHPVAQGFLAARSGQGESCRELALAVQGGLEKRWVRSDQHAMSF